MHTDLKLCNCIDVMQWEHNYGTYQRAFATSVPVIIKCPNNSSRYFLGRIPSFQRTMFSLSLFQSEDGGCTDLAKRWYSNTVSQTRRQRPVFLSLWQPQDSGPEDCLAASLFRTDIHLLKNCKLLWNPKLHHCHKNPLFYTILGKFNQPDSFSTFFIKIDFGITLPSTVWNPK